MTEDIKYNICVSIFANDFEYCLETVKDFPFVELRLDHGILLPEQLERILSEGNRIISTFRSGFVSDEIRFNFLLKAIEAGTYYIDLEHDFNYKYKNILIESANKKGCKIISSYHNYDETPNYNELKGIVDSLDNQNNIAKVACKVNTSDDLLNLLELYKELPKGRLVSFGLGEFGKISRLTALFLGAPFTYSSLSKDLKTSEGQLDYLTTKKILFELDYERK